MFVGGAIILYIFLIVLIMSFNIYNCNTNNLSNMLRSGNIYLLNVENYLNCFFFIFRSEQKTWEAKTPPMNIHMPSLPTLENKTCQHLYKIRPTFIFSECYLLLTYSTSLKTQLSFRQRKCSM